MKDTNTTNNLQKKLDEDLLKTKKICDELILNINGCKKLIDSIDQKLDRLTENMREENKND